MMQVAAWAKANWLLLIFLALIASAFIFLRSKPSNVASLNELDGLLSSGRPTVVEFYSNF
jgi:hypothetical protein